MSDWRAFSACKDEDPELFHPIGRAGHRGPESQAQEDLAKAFCARCPVSEKCLEFALQFQPDGIAGGLNEQERRDLRQQTGKRAAFSIRVIQPREICYLGLHPMVGDNVRIRRANDGRQVRTCAACYAAAAERRNAREAVSA